MYTRKEPPISHLFAFLFLMFLLYISGLTVRRQRPRANQYQLYLSGRVERDPDIGKLILDTPEAGRYLLIGEKADELRAAEEVTSVTVEGRTVRSRREARGMAIVEVLDYTIVKK